MVRRIRCIDGLMLAVAASLFGALAPSLGTPIASAASTRTPRFQVPISIASNGSLLWVTNEGSNGIVEINAATGSIVKSINAAADKFDNTGDVVALGRHLWVLSSIRQGKNITPRWWITELNANTGSLVRIIDAKADGLDDVSTISLAINSKDLWVANGNDSVTELNANTGSLVRIIKAKVDQLNSPTGITVKGPNVWVVNSGGNSVTELNATDGSLIRVIKAKSDAFDDPCGVTVSFDHVWVVNVGSNSVTELDATSGALVRIIK